MHRLERLRANIQSCFLGNQQAVDKLVVCLLARGHVLIEDVPGVGKTTLAIALSKSLDGSLSRIQLTPDMLPGDILGVTVWDREKSEFVFKPGPIFSNVVLADEINRTTPRTQSALLEAMNEAQVSMDGVTRRLLDPFLVIATQNPFEFEGTYFLPESQLDRFLMRLTLGYPSPEDEARVLTLDPRRTALAELKPVMTSQELVDLQKQAEQVRVDPVLVEYVVGDRQRDPHARTAPDRRKPAGFVGADPGREGHRHAPPPGLRDPRRHHRQHHPGLRAPLPEQDLHARKRRGDFAARAQRHHADRAEPGVDFG